MSASEPIVVSALTQQALGSILSVLTQYMKTRGTNANEASRKIIVDIAEKPRSMFDLQKSVQLPFQDFSQVVDVMLDANLVQLVGEPGEEVVELTPAAIKALTT